jgi:hypothetical protein
MLARASLIAERPDPGASKLTLLKINPRAIFVVVVRVLEQAYTTKMHLFGRDEIVETS